MKVIVNADDFGSTERHTRLILDLLLRGKISSTTMLVNLPYSPIAAKIIQDQHPQLKDSLGLHFNLTEGKPLNPDLQGSPFVMADGNLKDFRGRVSRWQLLRHVGAIAKELDLQIQRFHELIGQYPTHIDSHGHTHCTWVVLLALYRSREARKVPAIRLTRQYDHEPAHMSGVKNKIRRIAKNLLNFAFRRRFKSVDYFTDIRNLDGTWLREQDMEAMKSRFNSVEIMCHPYYFDEAEYEFLGGSSNVLERVPGLEMVGYSEYKSR
ncbi:MAG: ChbG/HpnK family deacetylase [Bacteroidia bacterium]